MRKEELTEILQLFISSETRQLQYISSPDGIKINDEIQGVRAEAERLKKEGVNILIAVGHAGYLKDMEIAQQVPDIDVVVGGHTNTFLWNGNVSRPKSLSLVM